MIQQSVGRLAFSRVMREPDFYPVAPPSSKGPGVHPGASVLGWEGRELKAEALTRTARGQACRQHTYSPIFHFSELRHMVVPSCKDTGRCSLPERAQKAEKKHIYWRYWLFLSHPTTVHMVADMIRGTVEKNQQN